MLQWHKFSELLPRVAFIVGNVSVDVLIRTESEYMVGYVSYDDGAFHVNAGHAYVKSARFDLHTLIRDGGSWSYLESVDPPVTYHGVRIDNP